MKVNRVVASSDANTSSHKKRIFIAGISSVAIITVSVVTASAYHSLSNTTSLESVQASSRSTNSSDKSIIEQLESPVADISSDLGSVKENVKVTTSPDGTSETKVYTRTTETAEGTTTEKKTTTTSSDGSNSSISIDISSNSTGTTNNGSSTSTFNSSQSNFSSNGYSNITIRQ